MSTYRGPPQRSVSGPLLFVGIGCGVLVLFMIAAVAVAMIGYDLARTTFKGPAKSVASSPPASNPPATRASPRESASTQSLPPSLPPAALLPASPAVDTLDGPVVVFQMLGYRGIGESAGAAKTALAGVPWFSGSVIVDQAAGEIVVGVRGSSVNTGKAKSALEAAGFQIGSTAYKPGGR